MKQMTGQDTSDVRQGHEFDVAALEAYMRRHLPASVAVAWPIRVRQFKVGQSNPTFLLEDAAGGKLVLRKKPPGKLIESAHMVEREFRILRALKATPFPVPTVYFLCEDASVLGTPFYVMEFLNGRIFSDVTLEELSPDHRRRCYESAIDTLALLHSLDFKKIGLEGYGREGDFYNRQIKRLSTTTKAQEIPGRVGRLPCLDETLEWFSSHLPQDAVSIVHGDYKFDNIVFHPTEPRVIGILDWEMSTIGHPLSDLSNICLAYYFPEGFTGPSQGIGDLLPEYGIPTLEELHRRYTKLRNLPYPIKDWTFTLSFAFWRMSVILQGVGSRGIKGQASNPMAEAIGSMADPLAEMAWDIIQANGALPKSKL